MGFFTDVMTVYNYRRTDNGEEWNRSIIYGIQWRHNKKRVVVNGHVLNEKPVRSITIDFMSSYDNPEYKEPRDYQSLDDVSDAYTLDTAGKDIVIYGFCPDEVTSDFTLTDLQGKHDCFTVTEVSDNRNRSSLKNIKVVAD